MKVKILFLFSLLALLLVSTAVLADGRPTGIRITRVVGSGGSTTPTVQIEISASDVAYPWGTSAGTTIMLGNAWGNSYSPGSTFYHYASSSLSVPFPPAIDWGDGNTIREAFLFGPSAGPWRGSFSHTYAAPGRYVITIGDVMNGPASGLCCVYTGNVITAGPVTGAYTGFYNSLGSFDVNTLTFSDQPWLKALTNTTVVSTGFGIPAVDVSGIIALSLLLVGTGLLILRKPRRTAI